MDETGKKFHLEALTKYWEKIDKFFTDLYRVVLVAVAVYSGPRIYSLLTHKTLTAIHSEYFVSLVTAILLVATALSLFKVVSVLLSDIARTLFDDNGERLDLTKEDGVDKLIKKLKREQHAR